MRPEDAASTAEALLRRYGLRDWTVRFDRARRRLGACFPRERAISLSRAFVELNDESVVLDTVRHEVAHALAWAHDGEVGHGPAWKRWCEATGARPRSCYDDEEVVLPEPRYRCTVLASEVEWSRGAGRSQQTGTARIALRQGDVFGRHRLTRQLRAAVEIGLVSVLDTKTGLRLGE